MNTSKPTITVEVIINTTVENAWTLWTTPAHITGWNFASSNWHCPEAKHQLKEGGKLRYKMAAKDGSMGFDYEGIFTKIEPNNLLEYTLDDERKVSIRFRENNGKTIISESFEIEDVHSADMQRAGWQAILNNFKKYAESNY